MYILCKAFELLICYLIHCPSQVPVEITEPRFTSKSVSVSSRTSETLFLFATILQVQLLVQLQQSLRQFRLNP